MRTNIKREGCFWRRMMTVCLIALFSMTAAYADSIPVRGCRPISRLDSDLSAFAARHAPRRTANGTNPYVGDRRQLVVLVSFNDLTFKQNDPMPQWERIFNQKDLDEAPYFGSVHDYFFAQSYGQLSLTFDLYRIELDETRKKYRSTAVNDENSQYLVEDIVDALRTKEIDWSQYDWDSDGFVDQLLIIYPGLGMHNGGDSFSIWPHQWWMTEHISSTGEKCQALTVTCGDTTYMIDSYCCVNEREQEETNSSFGTICHEYSHCFGLPDFYYNGTSYIYEWDVMDYGNYCGNGFLPVNYSAHERMFMGWLTPIELSEPTVVTEMEATSTRPVAYIIRNDRDENEYYLVENRQQVGWDSCLPGSGILIYHVAFDRSIWMKGQPNTMSEKRYSIFPANNKTGKSDASDWAYPYEQNDSLTNYSRPASRLFTRNSEGTNLMSKPLREMKVKDGLASFTFMTDIGMGVREIETNPSVDAGNYYDLTGRKIVNGKSVNGKLPRGLYISNGKKIFVR